LAGRASAPPAEEAQDAEVKLLLDGHIKKAALAALRRRCPGLDIFHIADWRGGTYRSETDADILAACFEENRTLVTYDQRTIPGLLREWASLERPHAGVIFDDRFSVPPNNPGAVAAALSNLAEDLSDEDMTNVIRYLRRPRS
jgi:hypothetical protein